MNQKRVLAILGSPHVNGITGSMLNYSRPYPEKDREMLGEAGEYEIRLKSQDIGNCETIKLSKFHIQFIQFQTNILSHFSFFMKKYFYLNSLNCI